MSVISRLRAAGFEVYTRREWGSPREADGSYAKRRGTHPMPSGPARYHFLHLTVTADTDTVQQGAAGARQIEGYGYSTPPMVSYQMLVTNEGRAYEGQSYGVKGTHTVNDKGISGFPHDLNLYGYAVALMQNEGDEVTDEQVKTAAAAFAAAELEGYVKRGAPIYPHRKFAYKACPGDKAVARLREIEALKNQYVATGLGAGSNRIGTTEEDDMALDDKLYAKKDDSPTVRDALKAILRLESAEKRRAAALRQQVTALRKAVDGNASPAEVREIVRNIEATIVLEVPEEEK